MDKTWGKHRIITCKEGCDLAYQVMIKTPAVNGYILWLLLNSNNLHSKIEDVEVGHNKNLYEDEEKKKRKRL